MRPWEVLLLTAVAGGLYLLARPRAKRLEPSGAGTLPPFPDLPPPPVAGYDHDDEPWDPDEEPPGLEDYDDRLPCVTQAELGDAMLLGDVASCLLPAAIEPKDRTPVPYADLPAQAPIWPVRANRRRDVRVSYQDVRGKWHGQWGRHFGAGRKSKDGSGGRRHAGIDLHGDAGDVVLAAEAGEVEAILPFTRGTYAIYVRSSDGTLVNYGEVARGSWREYGIESGVFVQAGQPLARVGAQTAGGAHMLHLEIYRPEVTMTRIRQGKMQWPMGSEPPTELLDPTRYLLAAQERWLVDHPQHRLVVMASPP